MKDKTDPLFVTVNLNDKQFHGDRYWVSSYYLVRIKLQRDCIRPLQESVANLCTYSGKKIQVKGEAMCNVEYEGKHYVLPIVVTSGSGPTLLGRTWLQYIPLNGPKLFRAILKVDDKLSQLLQSFAGVFKDELGTLQGEKGSDFSVPPKYCKARSLPYAMKEKVETELQRLQDQGIILPVKYSKWAAPFMPVLKQDKNR